MMWLARRKPWVAVSAALILATAGVAVQGRQQRAPGGAQQKAGNAAPPKAGAGGAAVPDLKANRALARQQLALIDQALAAQEQLYQFPGSSREKPNPTDSSFSLWARRRVETLRKTGAGKAEIVAALEKYINSLKQEEAIVEQRHMSARGTLVDVLDVRYRRIEAEIWLNEEKAR